MPAALREGAGVIGAAMFAAESPPFSSGGAARPGPETS